MSDTCAGLAGPQVAPCGFVGGSTLGHGPVGPADWSAKPLLSPDVAAPETWPGPILMAGWEFYSAAGLRRCYESLAQKYPPGWAYEAAGDLSTVLGSDVLARAEVTYDINRLACLLLDEWVCKTAAQTLTDWWADYGLPDECGINNLCAKVAAIGGANCEYFCDLAALLGYELTCDDIAPEIQPGCWDLGVAPMPPNPVLMGGGCDLGLLHVGECLGDDSAPTTSGCPEWWPAAGGVLLCGCAAPLRYDYTGTAYHVVVTLPQPMASIPTFAVAGSWSLGCVPLCVPPRDDLLCFLARYRPAHVVAVPGLRNEHDWGDIDGGHAGTDVWLGTIDEGDA